MSNLNENHINKETTRNFSFSPSCDLTKNTSNENKIQENFFKINSLNSPINEENLNFLNKKSSEIINFHDYENNLDKTPDSEYITNLRSPCVKFSNKSRFDISNCNNTPINVQLFNVTSPNNNNNILNSEKEKLSIRNKYEFLKQSVISNASNRKISDEGFCLVELKLIKKECELYKNCFYSLTDDFNNMKCSLKSNEENLINFYDESNKIFEKEVTCFWKALKVYKEIFTDQIKNKENKICELSKIFDEMVLGDNSVLLNNNLNFTNNQNFPSKFFFILILFLL